MTTAALLALSRLLALAGFALCAASVLWSLVEHERRQG